MDREIMPGDLLSVVRDGAEDVAYKQYELGRVVSRDGPYYKIEVFPHERVVVPRSAFIPLSAMPLPVNCLSRKLAKAAEYLFRAASNDAPAYYHDRCRQLLDEMAKVLPARGPAAHASGYALANLRAYLADDQAAALQGKYYMRNAGKAIAEMDGWNPELHPDRHA